MCRRGQSEHLYVWKCLLLYSWLFGWYRILWSRSFSFRILKVLLYFLLVLRITNKIFLVFWPLTIVSNPYLLIFMPFLKACGISLSSEFWNLKHDDSKLIYPKSFQFLRLSCCKFKLINQCFFFSHPQPLPLLPGPEVLGWGFGALGREGAL